MNINNNIKTLVKNFDIYVNNIEKNAKRHSKINDKDFRYKVQEFGDSFTNSNELPKFNKTAQKFAEKLVSLNNDKLAGIIYSTLIKLNRGKDAQFVEEVATKALAIAKRKNDIVHIAARTNDLKEIYKLSEYGSDRHLKILQEEKRALKNICDNYPSAKNRFETISRQMQPIERYEEMLAAIRLEVAEVLIKRNSDLPIAKQELLLAKETYDKLPEGHNAIKIRNILKKIG